MAKASIEIKDITPSVSSCTIKFLFKIKAGYRTSDSDGIRLYYSTTGSPTKDDNYLSITISQCPEVQSIPGQGVLCTYTFNNPTYSNKLYIQLRMKIVDDSGSWESYYASYKSDMKIVEFRQASRTQQLFYICDYYNKHTEIGDDGLEYEVWDKRWIDFTDCIELPSYDVNYEDVNEDWEDANYFTHRIRVRSKITGKLDLRFSDLARYNEFLHLLKKSKERNGHGTAYVELQLQINDDIDEYSADLVSEMRCTFATGLFFVKMDSNPWVAPVFGHYDKYQAISLSINEA